MIEEEAINSLLNAIDKLARRVPYPPAGLRIHGEFSERSDYVQLVRDWLSQNSPEGLR